MNGEVSSDVLKDTSSTWQSLMDVLDLLKYNGAVATEWCGAHVNIGSHILEGNAKYWKNFLLLWLTYSKEIYSFCTGEFCTIRNNKSLIGPINNINLKKLIKMKDINEISEYQNFYLINRMNFG